MPVTQLTNDSQPLAGLQLKDVLKTLPRECFVKNRRKAWSGVALSLGLVSLGYFALALAPWFLLPLAWLWTGTALTGLFVLAHDCGHRSFAQRRWVNDLVGHGLMLPLIYPFHAWRIRHNHHHRYTNQMDQDNAWQPLDPQTYASLPRWGQWGYQALRGPLWWLASAVHWGVLHFVWGQFTDPKERGQVRLSVLLVLGFALVAFPALYLTTGAWGVVKFWLVPWLGFHFWMSTFTLVHHTAVDIPFQPAGQWGELESQLSGTVHCSYPRWVEVFCHDINVHIPHHISTAIPSYNLRLADQSLTDNWGSHLKRRLFTGRLLWQIISRCHLYSPPTNYQTFAQFQRSQP